MHQLKKKKKIHVAAIMYSVFCQKSHISIRTIHELSIAIIRELVLLAKRCVNPKVDFLMTASKFRKTKVSIHCAGTRSPWQTENTTISIVKGHT